MQTDPIKLLHRWALLVVVTLALVATGFAHRIPSPSDQALERAVAQGLTAADLCSDKGLGQAHADQDCLACQIAGSFDLTGGQGELQKLDLAVLATVAAPRENRLVLPVRDPANAPQGPPVA